MTTAADFDKVTAEPLCWPTGKPRTRAVDRRPARFGGNWTVKRATTAVLEELRLLGVPDWNCIVSTNVALRRDGLPRSGQRTPDDPGVAVYFRLRKVPHVLACDAWNRVEHNLRAVALHIQALRGMDRWGVGSLEQAFAGYRALPETTSASSWRAVMGIDEGDEIDAEALRSVYRELALKRHPDRGGSDEAMAQLSAAFRDGLREVETRR